MAERKIESANPAPKQPQKPSIISYTKEQYYLLQEVNELNCINYKEYLEEKDNSIKFDESKTLYNLLRNAIYKQYLEE